MLTGECLCGSVRYEAEAPSSPQLTHCHCSMCRKHHGAPFASFLEVAEPSFRWLAGQDRVVDHVSSAARTRRFCSTCGAVAPTASGGRVRVPAGNVLGDLDAARGLHMFVGSKPVWHDFADGLPQHDAGPPGWVGEVERPAAPALDGATHGSCLCGAVSFVVSGAPARWMQCHCSRCRRGRSAAHGSNAFYALDQFAWRAGRELVRSYKVPDAERFTVSFCERCGGGAPVVRDKVPFVLVACGLLDGDPGARPEAHIYTDSKISWYTVNDGLPQFPEGPPPR